MRTLRIIISIVVAGLILALPFFVIKSDLDFNKRIAANDAQSQEQGADAQQPDENNLLTTQSTDYKNEWIIKWRGHYPLLLESQATILDWLPDQGITLIRLNEDIILNEWINQWKNDVRIEYMQPNSICSISTVPNDKYYAEQYYLAQIKAEAAWEEKYEREIIIAILDTGIDYNHSDLRDRVLPGFNILNNKATALDDNGHGTNIAGIIAARTNNTVGIAGIVQNAKLMPIKVLDAAGKSDSFYVGQGIRYAVDNGANIIVIASGESVYTPFIAEAAEYAYNKGVLIVAATGNKSIEINYPAALPNVIAVGAVDRNDRYMDYSNFGQQIDVVAPAEGIYTTGLNNTYLVTSGTSVAAPQVAALAAVLMQKYPELSLKQLSDLIRFSSDDVDDFGWDMRTGFGRINFENALNMDLELLRDGYGPNQRSYEAHAFPLGTYFVASLDEYEESDWFYITLPYSGTIEIDFLLERRLSNELSIELYTNEQATRIQTIEIERDWGIIDETEIESIEPIQSWHIRRSEQLVSELAAGKYYLRIVYPQPEDDDTASLSTQIGYSMQSGFSIYHDKYENNDRPWLAHDLINISEIVTGTFSKKFDEDWYRVLVCRNGTLSAEIRVDSKRVDPVLFIQRMGASGTEIDENSSGVAEYGSIKVIPGEYLVRVSDYNGNVTNKEYRLEFFFDCTDMDQNEPNNTAEQAKYLYRPVHVLTGSICSIDDYDWFKFTTKDRTYVEMQLEAEKDLLFMLYDKNLNIIRKERLSELQQSDIFDAGEYYIRLNSKYEGFKYSLKLRVIPLIGNFIDITDHYAQDIILKYYELGLVMGYEDYTFKPDQAITRYELLKFIDKYRGSNEIIPDDETLQMPVDFETLAESLADLFPSVERENINYIISQVNQVPYASISRAEALIAFDFVDNIHYAETTP